jgi:UTP--glucose-1-phosphate uridylyltransferase
MGKKICKAVFPVAGLGTRFLPATKANPKEMLPIVDKPLIQYAVEEAIAAGFTDLVFITSSAKRAIEDHFDRNFELESVLVDRGKDDLYRMVRDMLPEGVSCVYVRQPEALGLGHAVLCAEPVIGREPFAVILADDLIDGGDRPCLSQMVEVFEGHGSSTIGVEEVPMAEVHHYGVIKPNPTAEPGIDKIEAIVEKPAAQEAPSRLAVVGRYILTPRIFDLLRETQLGTGGEIQLTDAIASLLKDEEVLGYEFEGKRYDCGNKLGYLMATVEYAMKHEELSEDFRNYLVEFVGREEI